MSDPAMKINFPEEAIAAADLIASLRAELSRVEDERNKFFHVFQSAGAELTALRAQLAASEAQWRKLGEHFKTGGMVDPAYLFGCVQAETEALQRVTAAQATLRELEQDIRQEAIDCRTFANVPCQSESTWHADTYESWADKLLAVLTDENLT